MKNSLRTALCILSSFCLAAAVLVGCAQTGEERAQDYTQQNMLTQGYGTNNLVGAGDNMGNRNTRNNFGTNMGGNTGTNGGYNTGANNGTNGGFNTGINTRTNAGMNGNTNGTQISADDRRKASTIKRQLLNMNGVDEAEVIVMGNDCLVGVRNAGNANAGQLKSAITRRIKQIDNTIENVTVGDTSDIMSRMRGLGTGTRTNTVNGTGMNGTNANDNNMMENIADEFNRLMQKANNMTR